MRANMDKLEETIINIARQCLLMSKNDKAEMKTNYWLQAKAYTEIARIADSGLSDEAINVDFFSRISVLQSLGLVERITHLVDNEDEGEIIHELNDKLNMAARDASEALLSEQHDTDYEFLIPLVRHLKEATVVSTYRTTYKPRTSLTGGWYQESQRRNAHYLDKYSQILNRS